MVQTTVTEVVKDEHYTVNGKSVYKDSNDNWVAHEEFTALEKEALRKRNSKIFKDHE